MCIWTIDWRNEINIWWINIYLDYRMDIWEVKFTFRFRNYATQVKIFAADSFFQNHFPNNIQICFEIKSIHSCIQHKARRLQINKSVTKKFKCRKRIDSFYTTSEAPWTSISIFDEGSFASHCPICWDRSW